MIDKSKFYKFIYVSISFSDNPTFVKNLREKFPVEIPFLDMDNLNKVLKESLDSYFYIESNDAFLNIYKSICRKYPKISFTILGNIRGKDVFSFFDACKKENTNIFKVGDHVKLIEGDLKNLSAKISKIDKEKVEIEFPLLNGTKTISCNISDIILHENYTPLELNKFKDIEKKYKEKGVKNVLIVDGNNCLQRSMYNIPDKYNSKDNYIGGFFGFYFSLLKIKEMFPEYEIHVVFDELPMFDSEKVNNAYFLNLVWCKEFVKNIGFYFYFDKIIPAKNQIASLIRQIKETCTKILIYSTNEIFFSLLSENVSVFYPKTTFRGNSEFIDLEKVIEMYGVKTPEQVIWALIFLGKLNKQSKSVSQFFREKYGPKHGKIKPSEYIHLIQKSNTKEEILKNIQQDSKFSCFLSEFEKNLNCAKLNSDVPISVEKKDYDCIGVYKILEEVEMYKEIELWDRSERIFKGLW